MAGIERQLTGFATTAIGCVIILALCVLWALFDFYVIGGVWTIGPADFLVPLAVVIAGPVLIFCCLAMLGRRARGLPSWSRAVSPETSTPGNDAA